MEGIGYERLGAGFGEEGTASIGEKFHDTGKAGKEIGRRDLAVGGVGGGGGVSGIAVRAVAAEGGSSSWSEADGIDEEIEGCGGVSDRSRKRGRRDACDHGEAIGEGDGEEL